MQEPLSDGDESRADGVRDRSEFKHAPFQMRRKRRETEIPRVEETMVVGGQSIGVTMNVRSVGSFRTPETSAQRLAQRGGYRDDMQGVGAFVQRRARPRHYNGDVRGIGSM